MGEFKSDLCLSSRNPTVAPSIQSVRCVFTGAPAPSPASSYPHLCSSDPVTLLAPRRQAPSLFMPGLCTTLLWTWGSFPTGISGLTPSLHSDLCANITLCDASLATCLFVAPTLHHKPPPPLSHSLCFHSMFEQTPQSTVYHVSWSGISVFCSLSYPQCVKHHLPHEDSKILVG